MHSIVKRYVHYSDMGEEYRVVYVSTLDAETGQYNTYIYCED